MKAPASLPFVPGSDTSRGAAEAMAAKPMRIRRDHERILNVLLSGPKTDREMQRILKMDGSTQRPRRVELVEAVRVVDTRERRDRSTVWRLA